MTKKQMKQWRLHLTNSIRKEFGDLGSNKKNSKLDKALKANIDATFKYYRQLIGKKDRKKAEPRTQIISNNKPATSTHSHAKI